MNPILKLSEEETSEGRSFDNRNTDEDSLSGNKQERPQVLIFCPVESPIGWAFNVLVLWLFNFNFLQLRYSFTIKLQKSYIF